MGEYWLVMRVGRFDKVDGGLAALSVVAAMTSVVCSQFVKTGDDGIRPWWLVGQIVAAAAIAIGPTVSAVRAKRAEDRAVDRIARMREQSRIEMNEAFDPIVRKLGEMSVTTGVEARAGLRAEVMALTVAVAYKVVGPESGTRSCFFEFQSGPPKRLMPTDHHCGRMGSTRSKFVEGTPDGDAAISMVENNDHRLCSDVIAKPPPGWNDKKRDYRTFISVPVVAGGIAYGMLTVDALKPGDLDDNDANVLRVLAGLLAVALDTP